MIEIGMGIAFVIIVILAISGKGRTMLKGIANLFFEDIAKTPKGANAIYSQAIDEAQSDYTKSSNNLRKIAGMLETSKNRLEESKRSAAKCEDQCEILAKQGKFEDVETMANELELFKEEVKVYTSEVLKYTPMLAQSQQVFNAIESKLKKLKNDRKLVVRKLELDQQTKEMYDSLDGLSNIKSTDKLLDSVKEGVMESEEMATGSRAVYESKNSTKVTRINDSVKSSETSAYVESLRAKYKK